MEKTSVAVIGGGPGGYVAAIRAAQLGADVTLIEKDRLGGTCLNEGCIPTKVLLRCAHLLDEIKKGSEFGIVAKPEVDFTQMQKHKSDVVKKLTQGVGMLMKANKITTLSGHASFKDSKTLLIKLEKDVEKDVTLTPDKIIIASGSKSVMPPIPGIDSPQCVDSSAALSFEAVPASMVIIGGGVIGVELGSVYNSLGAKVTIVEMEKEILPLMDAELAGMLRKTLAAKGIEILSSAKVESIENTGGVLARVNVVLGDKSRQLEAEKVLISVGRRADVESLECGVAGITLDRGRIIVNENMRTSAPDIYAVGDCLGQTMLAHTASAQGETAAEHAMGRDAKYDSRTCPSCVYTEPEFASVGLTEHAAQSQGINYVVGKFPLMANGKSVISNVSGAVKIIADAGSGKVLGLHILSARASDMIAEGALAVGSGVTLDTIEKTIYAHPTISEAVREAALAAKKRAIHY